MSDLRAAAQQALNAMDTETQVRAVIALRAALEQPEQEPVAMLWKVRKALALASAICDRVPNRWHHTYEIGSAEADIGDMVNAHPDGTHGYRLIQEAEAELVAYLTTPEAAPQRQPEPEQEPVADSFTIDELTEAAVYAEIPDGQFQSLLIGLQEAVKQRAHPPRREWRGLTEAEMRELEKQFNAERVRTSDEEYLVIYPSDYWQWQRAIEAALKERNA